MNDGSYFSAGITVELENGFYVNKLNIIGLSNLGVPQWTKKYGGLKFEYLDNSFITRWFFRKDNYFYHAGTVIDSNNIYQGVFLKFNSSGDTVWQRKFFDGNNTIVLQGMTPSVDGGFLLTGFCEIGQTRPLLLIKTNSLGHEIWRKKINKNAPNVHDGKVVIQDSATKKIFTTGYQYLGGSSSWDIYGSVMVADSLGNMISEYSFTGAGGSLVDMIQTKEKKIVFLGQKRSNPYISGLDTYYSFIAQIDPATPNFLDWSLTFDKYGWQNRFNGITQCSNGDLMLIGNLDTLLQNNLPQNIYTRLTRINNQGVVLWNKYYNYNDSENDEFACESISINKTNDGGFISAIRVKNNEINPLFFVKYDSLGCDSSQSYCAAVGIEELNLKSISVYPTPCNNSLFISFPNEDLLEFSLINLVGKPITTDFSRKENQIIINTSKLLSGFYILNIYRDGILIFSKKVLKE